jgi:hypothetical protein
MSLRASSLPALSQCPCFESGSSEFAEAGTDRHTALQLHFAGDDSLLNLLPEEDQEGVRWAAEYIRVYAPMSEYPLEWEKQGAAVLADLTEIPGKTDAYCALDLFDLKWRYSDYTAQMALYAMIRLQAAEMNPNVVIRVHILYGCFKKAEVINFDYETASAIVEKIAAAYRDPQKKETPCGYCNYCANKLTCGALNERAQTVAAGREDWKLEQYHTSQITTPAEMSKALALAKQLKGWCEAVEFHAKEMAVKNGVTIPGYELKSKAGRTSCADVIGAFNQLPLTAEEFLQCCEVRIETSKENPDKRGLVDLFAVKKSISKAAAKREIKNLLQPHMRTPKEILYLKPLKQTEETEELNNA